MSQPSDPSGTRRIQAGPFNRVEGDLDIQLDITQGKVQSARVNSTLFRGFEQILIGKPALDALVYTPRICGICSVSQSLACAKALAGIAGIQPTANGLLSQNLVLANESMTDLLTHFYLFFMPDFARSAYKKESWYETVAERFQAVKGQATKEVLPARAEFLHLMGVMAGHWPHTLSLLPGGTSKPVTKPERLRLLAILGGFRAFLERMFGADLDELAELASLAQLNQWRDRRAWHQDDLRTFLHLSEQLKLDQLGRASDRFMSYGNFPEPVTAEGEVRELFSPGVWSPKQGLELLDTSSIREQVSHTWVEDSEPAHPSVGQTEVSLSSSEKPAAYSWCKAPRLGGQVVETGALARALCNQQPLFVELVSQQGASVHSRVLARLLELARVVPAMQRWAKALQPGDAFCLQTAPIHHGEGTGLIEAARGSLGHWVQVRNGRISHYQIVAPTTWNFSPRDDQAIPGALEQALEGTAVAESETDPVAVQHIVRSFDPCMVCTVH